MQENKKESCALGAPTDMNAREVKSPVPHLSDEERNVRIVAMVDSAIDDSRDILHLGRVPDDPGSSQEEEKWPLKSARGGGKVGAGGKYRED